MSEKIGIFGGSFNPVHLGHLNSLRTVLKKNKLSKIFLVPNSKNPLKKVEDAPAAEHRLNMVKLAIKDDPQFSVDDQELARGGTSYSIETIRFYESKYGAENVYFILGADSFESFDKWKNFEDILKATNLIVTTRPHSELPYSVDEFPEGIKSFIRTFEASGRVKLKTGREIIYTQLDDMDISATNVRKRLKLARSVDQLLTFEVEHYIKEHDLYPQLDVRIPDFVEFTKWCSQILFDRKALNVKGFDLTKLSAPSEYAIVASGTSTRQTVAIAEAVLRAVKEEYGVFPISVEGMEEGRWVLIDYGGLIIHLFYDYVRNEYRLEDLWKQGVDLELIDTKKK